MLKTNYNLVIDGCCGVLTYGKTPKNDSSLFGAERKGHLPCFGVPQSWETNTDFFCLQLPKNTEYGAASSASKRPLDPDVAASIADALMDDSGPDLDSLIDRMLTLTPNTPSPSEMMKELERLDSERERSRESGIETDGGEGTLDSADVPPELPPKQRPAGLQPNGDLSMHLGQNGAVPSLPEGPPRVPPRKKINKEKDSDSVSIFRSV